MSLFNFKTNTNGNGTVSDTDMEKSLPFTPSENTSTKAAVEIPEKVFIEPPPKSKALKAVEQPTTRSVNDLHNLYQHLEQNLEKKGYEDALINPDSSYMEENIRFIHNELQLLIAKVKTYYSGYLREIDFHIETRKRSGMLETVDELLSHRLTVVEELQSVITIDQETAEGKGISQNLVLGYRKGFKNGFAAITYNTILGRK